MPLQMRFIRTKISNRLLILGHDFLPLREPKIYNHFVGFLALLLSVGHDDVNVFFFSIRRFHDIPVGIFAETVAELRLLPEVYQMVEPGKGRFQIGRFQSGVQALG